jgi:hypothetical protein
MAALGSAGDPKSAVTWGNGELHSAFPPFADTDVVTSWSMAGRACMAMEMSQGPSLTRPSSECLTSPLTARGDLRKRGSAQARLHPLRRAVGLCKEAQWSERTIQSGACSAAGEVWADGTAPAFTPSISSGECSRISRASRSCLVEVPQPKRWPGPAGASSAGPASLEWPANFTPSVPGR